MSLEIRLTVLRTCIKVVKLRQSFFSGGSLICSGNGFN